MSTLDVVKVVGFCKIHTIRFKLYTIEINTPSTTSIDDNSRKFWLQEKRGAP